MAAATERPAYSASASSSYETAHPFVPDLFTSNPPIRDSLETDSSRLQDETVAECLPFLNGEELGVCNAHGVPRLDRDRHSRFLHKQLGRLPEQYTAADPSRPWIFYWCLAGLSVLGEDNESGGFAGGFGQTSHLATTYATILSLALVGGEEAYELVNRRTMWKWLCSLKQADGGFQMAVGGEEDTRGAYCAAVIISLLNIPLDLSPESPAYAAGHKDLFSGLAEWVGRLGWMKEGQRSRKCPSAPNTGDQDDAILQVSSGQGYDFCSKQTRPDQTRPTDEPDGACTPPLALGQACSCGPFHWRHTLRSAGDENRSKPSRVTWPGAWRLRGREIRSGRLYRLTLPIRRGGPNRAGMAGINDQETSDSNDRDGVSRSIRKTTWRDFAEVSITSLSTSQCIIRCALARNLKGRFTNDVQKQSYRSRKRTFDPAGAVSPLVRGMTSDFSRGTDHDPQDLYLLGVFALARAAGAVLRDDTRTSRPSHNPPTVHRS
ncbi:Protein farnesyltransferase subunit beta [Paramyrothecium foliicola]|nr:Protein farnesyltransferase subunit beta [Paramyrothecium foliicola]